MVQKSTYEELEKRVNKLEKETIRFRVADKKRKYSSQEWKTIFDAISDAVCMIDIKGTITRCNSAMATLLGKPYDEIIGSTCWELVHGTSEPIKGCPFFRMQETRSKESLVLEMGESFFNVVVDPLLNEEGDIINAVHIISDITDHILSEKALRESEEKYREIASNIPGAVYQVVYRKDGSSYFTYLSDSIEDIFEITPKEAIENIDRLYNRVHEDDHDTLEQAISEAVQTVGMFSQESRFRTKNGEIKWCSATATPHLLENGDVLFNGVFFDITERKNAEEDKERLITKLNRALENIKTLKGLLPICAKCKKIRDDKGYWTQIEGYIERHSEALFSHGLCPECLDNIYGNESWYKKKMINHRDRDK